MPNINLALSGGGIRAMAFHLGVMKYLAENGLMEKVGRISSVSGGSLITGFILKENGMRWPDSETFLHAIYPELEKKMCSKSLMKDMLLRLIRPENYKYLLYRANILAETLKQDWGITEMLGDLPETPEVEFEGTTAENGKRFRFKRDTFGDYDLGYADSRQFPFAQAMAVSAAFPGGIGAFELDTRKYQWLRAEAWDSSAEKKIVACPYKTLHLYDGGVYDNLGLEPFFDIGAARPKYENDFLLVSDAGSPFTKGFSYTALNPMRLKRVLDITMEQCRSLRIRGILGHFSANKGSGTYVWINAQTDPEHEAMRAFASGFSTTLCKLRPKDFAQIAGYGYLVIQKRLFRSDMEKIRG